MSKLKKSIIYLLPVLFSFFVMGFVDVVNISTSYVKDDFNLNDKTANLLPMMVFLWFAICSLPIGKLMNRIGRKNTVLLSALVTTIAMALPMISYTFPAVLVSFALLGIGNTILQVSLNPLMTDVTDRSMVTSMLTLGQFIKAISSTLGPVIVSALAGLAGNWKLVFPVYGATTILSFVWLWLTPISEQSIDNSSEDRSIRSLLSNKYLILLLSAIILSVGFEVGLMTTVPKYLKEKFDMSLEVAALGCSLYYIARTIGTFIGTFALAKFPPAKVLSVTVAGGILALIAFLIVSSQTALFVCLFLIGFCCANIFAIVFGAAMQSMPTMANEVSSLMIMGVAGGALIPPIMGIIADLSNQWTSLLIPLLALLFIEFVSFKLKTNK